MKTEHLSFPVSKLTILILILLINIPSFSQFNQLIFKKQLNFNAVGFRVFQNPIQPLGDQNNDGYGDFLLYDCSEKRSYIYYGGNPADTIPDFMISGGWASFNLIDINDDNQKDLAFVTDDNYLHRKIKIYYGGSLLDTIPDIVFNPPPGARNNFGGISAVFNDFDGDGRSELVYFDSDLPYGGWSQQYGSVYIYNTESTFDTIPHYTFFGDSTNNLKLYGIHSYGDINGDGLTDFTMLGLKEDSIAFRSFYLGNTNWNLLPNITYYENEHNFHVESMYIINDLNKDGKDDIIFPDYGFYPYYFYNVIVKGDYPIDTIPTWGLNTQNMGLNLSQTINLGDVNGDGFNDILTRTETYPVNLKLWLGGRKLHEIADKTWYGSDMTGFCSGHGAPGDINGDGVNDIAIWEKPEWPLTACGPGWVYIFMGDTSVKADTILVVTNETGVIPEGYMLYDPYPNPFNPNSVISWHNPIRSRVVIKIYDITGTEITVLLDEEKTAGEYKTEFDAGKYKLSSGVYFIQFECYDKGKVTYKRTKKLSYIK